MDLELLLNKVTSYVKDGVHVIDDKGITILYNRKMSIIQNKEIMDVMGKKVSEVFNDDQINLLKVLETGLPMTNQIYKGINKFGNNVITSNTIWPITSNQKTVGAIEIATDITEIRRLSDKAHKYSMHINAMSKKKLNEHRGKYVISDIIGESKAMTSVKELALAASRCDSNVMIIGASGTGKELIAQSIHNESYRKDKPLVAENCAAIPENLFESIFFGTTKGGFTGAVDKMGLFQFANGGTLILDEINSLPLSMQAKLLRVLQEGCFRPVGERKLVDVDVRIISITNEDPVSLIEKGKLREDLFYRLSVINIFVPSLSERKDDIKILTKYFLKKFQQENNKIVNGISQEVMDLFIQYNWKGNVRELANVIECGVDLVEEGGTIELHHLPHYFIRKAKANKGFEVINRDELVNSRNVVNLTEYMSKIERAIIEDALSKNNGNISKTAKSLGITRQALQYKLRSMQYEFVSL